MASEIPKSVTDQADLTRAQIDDWLKNDVFHLGWWILIALLISAIIVWVILLDKSRLKETILFAALCMIIVLGFDEYGDELILWDYPLDIIPIFRTVTSLNLLLLPMVYSLMYQYFKGRNFVLAALVSTAVICFVVEPLLALGNLYKLLNWQYWWSVPFYFVSALFVRKVVVKAFRISERNLGERR